MVLGAMLLGATLGMLLVVNVFRIMAGVRFSAWRHVVVAYLAGGIAGTFIYAAGAPEMGPLQFAGAAIAAALELALLYRSGAKREDHRA